MTRTHLRRTDWLTEWYTWAYTHKSCVDLATLVKEDRTPLDGGLEYVPKNHDKQRWNRMSVGRWFWSVCVSEIPTEWIFGEIPCPALIISYQHSFSQSASDTTIVVKLGNCITVVGARARRGTRSTKRELYLRNDNFFYRHSFRTHWNIPRVCHYSDKWQLLDQTKYFMQKTKTLGDI